MKQKLLGAANELINFGRKNATHLLTGFGIAGFVATSYFSVKSAFASRDAIRAAREDTAEKFIDDCMKSGLYENENDIPAKLIAERKDLSKKDMFKIVWKYWIPPVVMGLVSAGCIIGSDAIINGRYTALFSAYKIAEKGLSEYQNKVKETLGEKTHDKVLNEITKDHIENEEIPSDDTILKSRTGNTIIRDHLNGRYFLGDKDAIDKAVIFISNELLDGSAEFISEDDFFDDIGLYDHPSDGDKIGWGPGHLPFIEWRSYLKNDETPVLEMVFKNKPLPINYV